jgi:acyl-CoA reductase-like NAD-dependent aldehyde dehydrogenase
MIFTNENRSSVLDLSPPWSALMPIAHHPIYLGSKPTDAAQSVEVLNKYTHEPTATIAMADKAQVDEAIDLACRAQNDVTAMPAHARRDVLEQLAREMGEQLEEFARALVAEAGKPITLARGEVVRAIDTLRLCAVEALHQDGGRQSLDVTPIGEPYEAIFKRVPIGTCSFITPFNFPLNLAVHKIGPAIAAGCSFILKPDERTPITTIMLAGILAKTDFPVGAFSVLPCLDEARSLFTEDDRLKMLSFTGSPTVGWRLKAAAGRKRVVLELGGNAPCIVDAGVDLSFAAKRIIFGAYAYGGQSCISVQRVIAHESVYAELCDLLVAGAKALTVRDPFDEASLLSPLISEKDAVRVEQWVGQAVGAGAEVLTGGDRDGSWFEPTVVKNTPGSVNLSCEEVFGPVMTIEPFKEFDEALAIANDSEYGLQAGVFTPSIDRAYRAFDRLEMGGVVINDIPTTRLDAMPYGGVKKSGFGREGPRYSVEDMTDLRLMLLRR